MLPFLSPSNLVVSPSHQSLSSSWVFSCFLPWIVPAIIKKKELKKIKLVSKESLEFFFL
jgi:hypothetical protein